MKNFLAASMAFVLFVFIGCSGNDRDGAGMNQGGNTSTASAATQQDYDSGRKSEPDPAASGGTTLKASTPYRQPNGTTISQNLNPAPFMGGGQVGQSPAASSIITTNRAMGTVEGPMDQPPAGIGPGMEGQNPNASFPQTAAPK